MSNQRAKLWDLFLKDKLDEITKLSKEGLNQNQICKALGVSVNGFKTAKKEHPEIEEAIQKGKSEIVIKLRQNLIDRAINGTKILETKTVTENIELPNEIIQALEDAGIDTDNFKSSPKISRVTTVEKTQESSISEIIKILKAFDADFKEDIFEQKMREKEFNLKKENSTF